MIGVTSSLIPLFDQHPRSGWIRATELEELQQRNESLATELRAARAHAARPQLPGRIHREPLNDEQMAVLKALYDLHHSRGRGAWGIPEEKDRMNIEWLVKNGYLEFDRNRNGVKISVDGWEYMEQQKHKG